MVSVLRIGVLVRLVEERDISGPGIPSLRFLARSGPELLMSEVASDGNSAPGAEVAGTGTCEVAPGFDGDPDSWPAIDGEPKLADDSVAGVSANWVASESAGECEDVHVASRMGVGAAGGALR